MPGILGHGTFASLLMKLARVQSPKTLLLLGDGGAAEANISSCVCPLSHLLCVLGLLADLRLIRSALTPACAVTHTKFEYRNGTAWPVKTRLTRSWLHGGVAKSDDHAYIIIIFLMHIAAFKAIYDISWSSCYANRFSESKALTVRSPDVPFFSSFASVRLRWITSPGYWFLHLMEF